MNVLIPLRTVSEANARQHHMRRAERAKHQRFVTYAFVHGQSELPALPVTVLLVRVGPKRLDDDNLRGALKAVRDGVADALGLRDDSDPRVTWAYDQAKGAYGVRVVIEPRRLAEELQRAGILPGKRDAVEGSVATADLARRLDREKIPR